MTTRAFYDDIADYYDLIFEDWEASMRRQGDAIAEMIGAGRADHTPGSVRVLDVAAGIGTQSLPLASLGYDVTARDLSPGAIARLAREAATRGLSIDARAADMRDVAGSVTGPFDAVIAFDNSIPHLLSDEEITAALRGLGALLASGGAIWLSVRDYDRVERNGESYHPYGERRREGRMFRLAQEWAWVDASHYRTTMVVEERDRGGWRELLRTAALYYAISLPRLLELMGDAGFRSYRVGDVPFYQPVLTGCAG